MENDGIQRLLQAEDAAAEVVHKARENRVVRLRQARQEAEKENAKLQQQLQEEFDAEYNNVDAADVQMKSDLDAKTQSEIADAEAMYDANKETAINILLHHACSASLHVDEALKQSLSSR